MIYIYILLIAFAAFPLIVLIVRLNKYNYVIKNGNSIQAQVTEVRSVNNSRGGAQDIIVFAYLPKNSPQYFYGSFTYKWGKYKTGDRLVIYYLPNNPRRYAVPGVKYHVPMIILFSLFFLFVIFACYKIHEMVGDEKIYFNP